MDHHQLTKEIDEFLGSFTGNMMDLNEIKFKLKAFLDSKKSEYLKKYDISIWARLDQEKMENQQYMINIVFSDNKVQTTHQILITGTEKVGSNNYVN